MYVVRYQIASAGLVCVLLAGALYANHSTQKVLPPDADSRVIHDNILAKEAIAQDLIAERLTLAETIAEFRAVDARRPSHLPLSLPEVGGESVEQRYARYVTSWAQDRSENQPGSEAVSTRLDGERREYLAGTPARPLGSAGQ